MASKIIKNHEKPRMVQILEDMREQLQKMDGTVDELMQLVMMDAKYDEKVTDVSWQDEVIDKQ
ncbi:unnamed protein product [marine sediment metagenome]|uniref:Uncharacterized protein n=1 Tax=marine sediment metagenome TaxID=412755 RepID=X0TC50_9ZZZZ